MLQHEVLDAVAALVGEVDAEGSVEAARHNFLCAAGAGRGSGQRGSAHGAASRENQRESAAPQTERHTGQGASRCAL